MIYIIGPNYPVPEDGIIINTTSRSSDWGKEFSPFFLGPVNLYANYKSINMENGWQYTKVYEYYCEDNGEVGERYFNWAQDGWSTVRAHRYPMGKGVKPLYSYWDGEKLSYIEARKKIYIPLYSKLVQATSAFDKLKHLYDSGQTIYLWDFDGYDHKSLGMSYQDVVNNPNLSMGHAFIIAALIERIDLQ